MKVCSAKQYRNITDHLHLYPTNYYIYFCTITLLLLVTLNNASISLNMTFTPILIFCQISLGSKDLFLFFVSTSYLVLNFKILKMSESSLKVTIPLLLTIWEIQQIPGQWTQLQSPMTLMIWSFYMPLQMSGQMTKLNRYILLFLTVWARSSLMISQIMTWVIVKMNVPRRQNMMTVWIPELVESYLAP